MTREQAGWVNKYVSKDDNGLKKTAFLESLKDRIADDLNKKPARKKKSAAEAV